jgi:predicted permease
MDVLLSNVRYAARRLLRAPLFTLVAVLSLALGIGANTAIFSLVNAVLIRNVALERPEELVDVFEASEGFSHGTLSYPDYVDFVEASRDVFSGVGGIQYAFVQMDVDGGVETVMAEAVTGNYFSLLGVQPAVGRLISENDHVDRGAHPVVVLSHDHWQSRYAGDPGVVGSELRLGGRSYSVIGVAPRDFRGSIRGLEAPLYVPILMYDEVQGLGFNTLEARGNHSMFAKARLLPGVTFAEAEAVAERLTRSLRVDHPNQWPPSQAFTLVPTADVIMNPMLDRVIVPAAGMLMAVAGLVLLIACANLASFLLARATDRRKEIALRLALGARRRTLVGQLLTETMLLSTVGGVAGVVLAVRALQALAAADLPLPLPITFDLSLDRTVLGFSLLVSIGAGLLFGLAPALQGTRADVAPTLRDEGGSSGRGRGAALRDVLVAAQVAVSVVLLVGASLFLRSLDASRSIDPGFGDSPAGILQINVPSPRYSSEEGRIFLESLAERIGQSPGVERVGYIDNLHLNTLSTQSARVEVPGIPPPAGSDFHSVDDARVDDGFFAAAGISIVDGRGFDERDVLHGEPAVVVTQEFARRFFPGGAAVGATIVLDDEEARIVGVASDHKVRNIGEDLRPFLYTSHRQSYAPFVWIVARTSGDADRLALDMIDAARAMDPEIMIVTSTTMERHLSVMFVARELGALVVGSFALLALLLASIGLYGLVSYAVARRVKEVGIRLSLGADEGSVVRMLTGSGMKLVAIGGALGLVLAAGLARLLASLLYGIPALDLPSFVAVPLVLAAVALAASWIPARRVTRIDPVGALRSE